jgi:hypothetical protein
MAADAVNTSEDDALEAFGWGQHAFAILPTYRMRFLNNDPARFREAGQLPRRADAQWRRGHGAMTPAAGCACMR